MKILTGMILAAVTLVAVSAAPQDKPLEMRVVNFKHCVEKSKLGKQEQANFDSLKKQMESILEEKEKTLNDMAGKLGDPDYLDSISPEAETELKRKFRALSQEYTQQQNQYLQTLNQTNFKIVQKLNETVSEITKELAEKEELDLVLNEEACFFFGKGLDFSDKVVEVMDQRFEKEANKK